MTTSHPASGLIIERKMDVYLPVTDTAELTPAIIFIHGNPENTPYPNGRHHGFQEYAKCFVNRGYAVFVIAWDLSDSFVQVRSSVRHVRAESESYNVDPDKIASFGHSYGGSWSIALATAAEHQGEPNAAEKDDPMNNWGTSAKVAAAIAAPGGVFFAGDCDPTDAPILYIRGTEDFNFQQVEGHLAALNSGNVPYAWFSAENAGHGIPLDAPVAFDRNFGEVVSAFLALHLQEDGTSEWAMVHGQNREGGRIEFDPIHRFYPKGTEINLRGQPEAGYNFDQWTGDVSEESSSNSAITLTVNKNLSITVKFTEK